jgi:general secretion pathway protein D
VVIPLQHASAIDVAATINRLFAEAAQAPGATAQDPTQRFAVVADARSNSLLARAGDPSRLARLRKFVALLDSPTNAAGNIHVVYLKNAEAVKLAETLRAIYQGDAAQLLPRSDRLRTRSSDSACIDVRHPATTGAAAAPSARGTARPEASHSRLRLALDHPGGRGHQPIIISRPTRSTTTALR